MPFTIATWNINSVRLRLDQVLRLLETHAPDALALQEIKCRDEQFPASEFRKRGYIYQAVYGVKGYHGVAILSRHPFHASERHQFCDRDDGRCITAVFDAGPGKGIELAAFYVPAGGDIPDPDVNERFAHKLQFLDELAVWSARFNGPGRRTILVGDLNVAPLETDVWSHKQLLDVVSHTPMEVARFERVMDAGGWIDVMREIVPPSEKLFTWWSYRATDWRASNRGRRLDHVWASAALKGACQRMIAWQDTRDWDRPSDHIPVIATFET